MSISRKSQNSNENRADAELTRQKQFALERKGERKDARETKSFTNWLVTRKTKQ